MSVVVAKKGKSRMRNKGGAAYEGWLRSKALILGCLEKVGLDQTHFSTSTPIYAKGTYFILYYYLDP